MNDAGEARAEAAPVDPVAAERAFRAFTQGTAFVSVLLEDGHRIAWVSASVSAVLGHEACAVVGLNALELIHPDDVAPAARLLTYVLTTGEPYGLRGASVDTTAVVRVRTASGGWRPMEVVGNPLLNDPDVHGLLLVLRDCTERQVTDQVIGLMARAAPLAQVLANVVVLGEALLPGSRVAITVAPGNRDRDVVVADGSDLVLPTSVTELVIGLGRSTLIGVGDPSASESAEALWAFPIVNGDDAAGPLGCLTVRPARAEVPSTFAMAVVDRVRGLASLAIAHEQLLLALRHAASHDPLTNLANRTEIERVLAEMALSGPIAVAYIDLDNFRQVNNDFGHGIGDSVIIEVAKRLREAIRPDDVAARMGGDEFVVALRAVGTPAESRAVAERIAQVMLEPVLVGDAELPLSFSVGVSSSHDAPGSDPDRLIDFADHAQRAAKRLGGARVLAYGDTEVRAFLGDDEVIDLVDAPAPEPVLRQPTGAPLPPPDPAVSTAELSTTLNELTRLRDQLFKIERNVRGLIDTLEASET